MRKMRSTNSSRLVGVSPTLTFEILVYYSRCINKQDKYNLDLKAEIEYFDVMFAQ